MSYANLTYDMILASGAVHEFVATSRWKVDVATRRWNSKPIDLAKHV